MARPRPHRQKGDAVKLDELRKLLEASTPGEWFEDEAISGDGSVVMSENDGLRIAHLPNTRNVTNGDNDAAFIAAAHNHMAALLDVAEAAKAFKLANHAFLEAVRDGEDTGQLVDDQQERIRELWAALARLETP